MDILIELFLLPFLVGVAVFLAELLFKWFQRPRPLLERVIVTSSMITLKYSNLGRTALHSPVINISGLEYSCIKNFSKFELGKTGVLIFKPGNVLLPGGISTFIDIEIEGDAIPHEIQYLISGEEVAVRGKVVLLKS